MEEKIALYTFCNISYVEPTMVLIYSFLKNNSWFDGDIVILYFESEGGLSPNMRNIFIQRFGEKIKFEKIDLEDYIKVFNNHVIVNKKGFWSLMFYLKFDIFKNTEYDIKVYLDADIVVNGEIKELFYNDFNEEVLVVQDEVLPPLSEYFNAGVLAFKTKNLPENFREKLISFAENFTDKSFKKTYTGYGELGDQDVLNEVFTNKRFINYIYNAWSSNKSYKEMKKCKIVHYYGQKPWQDLKHENDEAELLYFKYYYCMMHDFKNK